MNENSINKSPDKRVSPQQVRVTSATCFGTCGQNPSDRVSHLLIRPDKVLYRVRDEADLDEIIRDHLVGGRTVKRLLVPGKTIGPASPTSRSGSSTVALERAGRS